jgi:membrane associated rhomboid family serine protease
MILPIGFGKRVPTFPWLSIATSVLIIITSMVHFTKIKNEQLEIDQAQEKYQKSLLEFSKNNCQQQIGNTDVCKAAAELLSFSVKDKNSKLDAFYKLSQKDRKVLMDWMNALRDPKNEAQSFHVEELLQSRLIYFQELQSINTKAGIITPQNINLKSAVTSFLSHANWLHLMSNLFVLFFFLRLLEARYPRLLVLTGLILTGTLGLVIEALVRKDDLVGILGASAGVSGIIGVFWVTYFTQNMRVIILNPWTWFSQQDIYIPTSWGIPVFIVSMDVIGLFTTTQVAHGAHIYGFLLGSAFGLILRWAFPLAKDFLYEDEFEKMYHLKTNPDLSHLEKIQLCREVLEMNPQQAKALQIGLKISQPQDDFFQEFFTHFLELHKKIKKPHHLVAFLNQLDWNFDYHKILKKMGPQTLLDFGQFCLEIGNWQASLHFYSLYAEKFASKKNSASTYKTIVGILNHGLAQKNSQPMIKRWLESLRHPDLKLSILKDFPQI